MSRRRESRCCSGRSPSGAVIRAKAAGSMRLRGSADAISADEAASIGGGGQQRIQTLAITHTDRAPAAAGVILFVLALATGQAHALRLRAVQLRAVLPGLRTSGATRRRRTATRSRGGDPAAQTPGSRPAR